MAEPDSRTSLRHILADDPAPASPAAAPVPAPAPAPVPAADTTAHPPTIDRTESKYVAESNASSKKGHEDTEKEADKPVYTSTTTTTRRNANGSVSSVYSGNKIKHLKKEDGIPLWRKDIQFDFLKLVFEDQTHVFTKYSDGSKGHTFAEIYIDAMAKSSKCSKILKEKLIQDHTSALSMAMVCLLVNVGRMNTTLNFFPEMRAQLRTYHSIPALQAHQDPNAYKQLQDAPRLKSILKGATEDEPQPMTVEDIKAARIPRTNPVNLIFVLSQYAPKISEVHFTAPRDFFDLVMRASLSSRSRATAFLWLIWWYLESNFTYEDSQKNPFGPGLEGEGAGGLPIKVPAFESLTEEQAALENVDTEEEKTFGEIKRKERIAILASEPSPAMTALKRARKERSEMAARGPFGGESEGTYTPSRDFQSPIPHGSANGGTSHLRRNYTDSENERSPSPPVTSSFQAVNAPPKLTPGMRINNLIDEGSPSQAATPASATSKKSGPGRGNWRRNKDPKAEPHATPGHPPLLPNTSSYGFVHETPSIPPHTPSTYPAHISPQQSISFAPPATSKEHIPTPSYQTQKRTRPMTQHQQSLAQYRRRQVEYVLRSRIHERHMSAKRKREDEGALLRAWKRIRNLPSGWDSDDENPVSGGKDGSAGAGGEKDKVKPEDDIRALKKGGASVGVTWLAGFASPQDNTDDDVGEEAKYYTRALRRCERRMHHWDALEATADLLPKYQPRRPPTSTTTASGRQRPSQTVEYATMSDKRGRGGGATTGHRVVRRANGGDGGARKSVSVAAEETETPAGPGQDEDDDDDMEVGDADVEIEGQLDDEDRELLGEVDADESEDEDDDDGMDEDG